MSLLSLILCSRNDEYLGNSRWRLTTTLNDVGARIAALGLGEAVEVIVADWGSEVPLAEVISLTAEAARIVRFLHVPPATARARQRESPFPEVIALNAAARRASGQFIGRIDQDTLVGETFLGRFLSWADGSRPGPPAVERTLLFANRRSIPYRFAVRCPDAGSVRRFVRWFGSRLRVETSRPPVPFYHSDVGIWLAHRTLWDECGGYDERMIYMNDMEIDMVGRLLPHHPMVDLGPLVEYDFYHLDHYHPRGSRSSSTHRLINAQYKQRARGIKPSGAGWGLADLTLRLEPTRAPKPAPARAIGAALEPIQFAGLVGWTVVATAHDRVRYRFLRRWRGRAGRAWSALRVQPVMRWPRVLGDLWMRRT